MNNFNLIGRVNYINIKYTDSGKCVTRVLLSKKVNTTGDNEKDYASFPVTFFNTRNKNAAEDFGEYVKKGDYVQVEGKLQMNSYKGKSGDNITTIELIGFDFKKVRYDEDQEKYVEDETPIHEPKRYGTVEKSTYSTIVDEEEIPF